MNDFDFDNNTVSITKNYARLGSEDIIQTPKTPKSKRTITLPAEIMEMVINVNIKSATFYQINMHNNCSSFMEL